MRRLFLLGSGLTALLVFASCTDDNPGSDDDVGETAGTEDTGITSLGTADAGTETGDTGNTSDTGDTTGGDAVCGNDIQEAGEECDDGNTEDGDGCSATCQYEGSSLDCEGTTYQCGDGLDNDMDGFIDLDDPECISPCDDNELSFETDLPGQNNDCKGDCYFDSNSGGGDDKCEWNLQCDEQNPGAQIGCEYDPDLGPDKCGLEMPPECLDFCAPSVPNGCDCFGCCEIDGQLIYLGGANCSLDNLEGCESCTFFENCNNPCDPEECELCFGQDPEDLPEECGGEPKCPPDLDPCTDSVECMEGWYCQTGCCVPVSIG